MSSATPTKRTNDVIALSVPESAIHTDKLVEGYIHFLTQKAGQTRALAEAVILNPTPETLMASFNVTSLSEEHLKYLQNLQNGARMRSFIDKNHEDPEHLELAQWAKGLFLERLPDCLNAESPEEAIKSLCQTLPSQYAHYLEGAFKYLARIDASVNWKLLKKSERILYIVEAVNDGILDPHDLLISWVRGLTHNPDGSEVRLRSFGLFKIEEKMEVPIPELEGQPSPEDIPLYCLSGVDPKYPSSHAPLGYWDGGLMRIVIDSDLVQLNAYEHAGPLLPMQILLKTKPSHISKIIQSAGYEGNGEQIALFFVQSGIHEEITHCVNAFHRSAFTVRTGGTEHSNSLTQREAFNAHRLRPGTHLQSWYARSVHGQDPSTRLAQAEVIEEAYAKTNIFMHSAFPQLELAVALDMFESGHKSHSDCKKESGLHYFVFLGGLCETYTGHSVRNFDEITSVVLQLLTLDDDTLRQIGQQTLCRIFNETPETLKRFPIPKSEELLAERQMNSQKP